MRAVVREEPVVQRVVETAEAEGRPGLVALGRVVEHHVEHDLESGVVQRADHGLELGHRVVDRIAGIRREPRERVVTPVVRESALDQELLRHEGLARHQLDRRDADALQVIDHGRLRESEVLAAQMLRYAGVPLRETLDVQLVDDRVAPRDARRTHAAPVECRIGHAAPRHVVGAVGRVRDPVVAGLGAVQRRVPRDVAGERGRAGIHQQLGRIESMPVRGLVRAVHPVTVQCSRAAEARGQETVPDAAGPGRQCESRDFTAAGGIEEAQLDAGRTGRERREIDAAAGPAGARAAGRCPARGRELRPSAAAANRSSDESSPVRSSPAESPADRGQLFRPERTGGHGRNVLLQVPGVGTADDNAVDSGCVRRKIAVPGHPGPGRRDPGLRHEGPRARR